MSREANESTGRADKFRTTGGPFVGWLGIAAAAAVVVMALVDGGSSSVAPVAGAVLAGTLLWTFLIRPAVILADADLVLRGPISDTRLPLGGIDTLVVGAFLTVGADGAKFTNAAVGRSLRQSRRDRSREQLHEMSVGAVIEARLVAAIDNAREQGAPAASVRRTWAWPEIAVLAGSAIVLAGALVAR